MFTSRFSNSELRTMRYTPIRISLGTPKWELGYPLAGCAKTLMPFGLLGKYEAQEDFEVEYFQRLDRIGVARIREEINSCVRDASKPVVLLCYEDIRKPGQWCHRTSFAKWWKMNTGEEIEELPEKSPVKVIKDTPAKEEARYEQISLF